LLQRRPPARESRRGGVVTVNKKETAVAGRDDKPKRENVLQRLFRETIGELKKVSWPTRQEALNMTIVVIVVMTGVAVFLWLIDLGASRLIALAIGA
jgi:preprotein translocase subunit SecE